MAEEYVPFTKRIKSLLGMGAKDINLPIEGAAPAARKRATTEKAGGAIKALQDASKRVRQVTGRDTEGHAYDFRQRNNLKRGQ